MAPTAAPLEAYVGLGANLGDPAAQLRAALAALARLPGTRLSAVSGLYRSAPLGPQPQPDYCNAVCALITQLLPEDLLDRLQTLEAAAGRRRGGPRWGPRPLDLDLLHVPGLSLDTPRLRLPHPELHQRRFVLQPLAEIAPDLLLPGLGEVKELLAALPGAALPAWPQT